MYVVRNHSHILTESEETKITKTLSVQMDCQNLIQFLRSNFREISVQSEKLSLLTRKILVNAGFDYEMATKIHFKALKKLENYEN